MPTPTKHKTVQARILQYAESIGWKFIHREEAEQRRGFNLEAPLKDRAKGRSLFFDDMLDTKVREFNPRYTEEKAHFSTSSAISTQTSMATVILSNTCATMASFSITMRTANST